MFFANNILNKKGPLGGVWLAAHVEDYKKLTKQQIHQTKVVDSVGTPPESHMPYLAHIRSLTNPLAQKASSIR